MEHWIIIGAYFLGLGIVAYFIYKKTSWNRRTSLRTLRTGFYWLIVVLTLLATCGMMALYQVEWYWYTAAIPLILLVSLGTRIILFDAMHRLHNRRH